MNAAASFAAVAATLYAGHHIADHVLGQTHWQALTKAQPGANGWCANVLHVSLYHLVLIPMACVAIIGLDLAVTASGWMAGMGFSIVSHLVLDRRWPVRWLLEHTGSGGFARLGEPSEVQVGINGMYLADQSLHLFCLWVSALLMVMVGG